MPFQLFPAKKPAPRSEPLPKVALSPAGLQIALSAESVFAVQAGLVPCPPDSVSSKSVPASNEAGLTSSRELCLAVTGLVVGQQQRPTLLGRPHLAFHCVRDRVPSSAVPT